MNHEPHENNERKDLFSGNEKNFRAVRAFRGIIKIVHGNRDYSLCKCNTSPLSPLAD